MITQNAIKNNKKRKQRRNICSQLLKINYQSQYPYQYIPNNPVLTKQINQPNGE